MLTTASPGKVPEQSRAYLHLTSEAHIKPFEAKFLSVTFHDAKGTHKDPSLKYLPPTLGFAPNQRVPALKQRVDGRQGTIDQDPEFIAFLEGETQPVTKPAALDASAEKPREKVKSTPLIDDLREKKAKKAVAAKTSKQAKDEKASEKAKGGKGATDGASGKGTKAEQATKDAVKAANKQANKAAAAAAASPAKQTGAQATERKRERVTPNAIKNMLQRDLGLQSPKRGGRQAQGNAIADASGPPSQGSGAATTAPAGASSPAAQNLRGGKSTRSPKSERKPPLTEKGNGQTGGAASQDGAKASNTAAPNILKKAPAAQPTPRGPRGKQTPQSNASPAASASSSPARTAAAPASKPQKPAPTPSPGATKAYLKHANASQGVNEPLLRAALAAFGPIKSLEIDKRKGTALAEFETPEGLKAAMGARSVPVAQGAVEVLEFKEKPAPAVRGGGMVGRGGRGGFAGRGGRGGMRGGAAAATTVAVQGASPAPAEPAGDSAPAKAAEKAAEKEGT